MPNSPQKQLCDAIDAGDLTLVKEIVKNNPHLDLNNITPSGLNALWWCTFTPPNCEDSLIIFNYFLNLKIDNRNKGPNRLDIHQPYLNWKLHDLPESHFPQSWRNAYRRAEFNFRQVQHADQYDVDEQQRAFMLNPQNTHCTFTANSCDDSVRKLYLRYCDKLSPQLWQQVYNHLLRLAKELPLNGKYQMVEQALTSIEKTPSTRPLNNNNESSPQYTLVDICQLVYLGCIEKNKDALPDDTPPPSDSDITHRLATFINRLIDAQTEYGNNGAACWMGARHQIVDTLHKIHRDVFILRADIVYVIRAKAKALLGELFESLSWAEKIALAQDEYLLEAHDESSAKALALRNRFTQAVMTSLKSIFSDKINKQHEAEINYLVNNFSVSFNKHFYPINLLMKFVNRGYLTSFDKTVLPTLFRDATLTTPNLLYERLFEISLKAYLDAFNQALIEHPTLRAHYLTLPETLKQQFVPFCLTQDVESQELEDFEPNEDWLLKGNHFSNKLLAYLSRFIYTTVTDKYEQQFLRLPRAYHAPLGQQYLLTPHEPLLSALLEALKDYGDLAGMDFTGQSFEGMDLRGLNLQKTNLTGVNLKGADLRGAKLEGAIWKDVNLQGAQIPPQLIYQAIKADDLDNLKALINAGVELNPKNHKGQTPMHWAAQYGKLDCLKTLISAGAKLNPKDHEGQTPMHWAAQYGKLDCLKTLISAGAKLNPKDHEGQTPMHLAADCDELDCLITLISAGAELDPKDDGDQTPMRLAATNVALNCFKALINAGVELNHRDHVGDTLMHWAAYGGELEHLKTLISAGAELNPKNTWSKTPIHLATQEGKLDCLKTLISAGAELNPKNHEGQTPIHLATQEGKLDCLKTLISAGAELNPKDHKDQTPIHLAAQEGKLDCLKTLISAGAELNPKDHEGQTPMHLAAQYGKLDCLKTPISAGAELNPKNYDDQTPMHLAAQYGKLDCLKTLISAGAELNPKDRVDKTPIHLAADYQELDCLITLINAGAELNPKDGWDQTPIHWAAQVGKLDCLITLISAGAELNPKNHKDQTPIHLAAQGGKLDCLITLINAGAELNPKNHKDQTPIHLAAQEGKLDCLITLINAGAERNPKNHEGQTPMHWAAQYGKLDCLKTLISAGAELNPKNLGGQTPMHLAAQYGKLECLKALINAGASLDAADCYDNTPLHYSADNGNARALKALINAGADTRAKNASNKTPLHFAFDSGSQNCIDLIEASRKRDLPTSLPPELWFSYSPLLFPTSAYQRPESPTLFAPATKKQKADHEPYMDDNEWSDLSRWLSKQT